MTVAVVEKSSSSEPLAKRLRVLVAKPGLDGHDRGARVIARLLREEGYEVVYTGIRQRPAMIVQAAIDEDVDVIGLSVLSGAHMALTAAVMDELCASDVDEIKVVVGGTIPSDDASRLRDLGVTAVFGVGTHIDEIREWFRNQ
jgi:methylmalonyl-CoA mutase, C-terminal domain